MKMRTITKYSISLRNALHSIAPNFADRMESRSAIEQYRRLIAEKGFQVPLPQFIKRSIIKKIILEHNCHALVETGTYLGDTPWALRNDLEAIYSIELSADLAALAQRRFKHYPKVEIVVGDSGQKLRDIVPRLKSKTLFWLDGHYSAGFTAQGKVDCPIFDELETILRNCSVSWVILIDDARCFGVDRDYPSISELSTYIKNRCSDASIVVENDIIRVSR